MSQPKWGDGAVPIPTLYKGDGPIELDSVVGKQLGFTSDKFEGWLWKNGGYVYVSYIVSKEQGRGNLSKLFKAIQAAGFGIKVPTPFAKMEKILIAHNFKKTEEYFDKAKMNTDVWVKEPRRVRARGNGGIHERR